MTLVVTPITSLPAATILNDADLFVINQGATTKKITADLVVDLVLATLDTAALKLGAIDSGYTTGTVLSNAALIAINIKYVSGSPTFKIGSTSGGAEVLNETEAITEDVRIAMTEPCYSKTIYPRITGAGTLNITLIFEKNLF